MIGQLIDGKYRLEKQLGQGGMGAVYLATHLGTKRPVALKLITSQFAADAEFVERFKIEAESAGRLRHPNVVNVTDFGFAQTDSTSFAYLVMEYLEGSTLDVILEKEGRLPLSFVVDITEQICLGAQKAHENGIVHRDLKPQNIWLEPDGRGGYNVKVLDFGLAKFAERDEPLKSLDVVSPQLKCVSEFDDSNSPEVNLPSAATVLYNVGEIGGEQTLIECKTNAATLVDTANTQSATIEQTGGLTRFGAVLGTPMYMSPEQCQGGAVDFSSDIYSLAVIVYEMLTGELPFAAADVRAMLNAHINEPPPSLSDKCEDVPPLVAEFVMSALAKNRAERPPSMSAFAGALRVRAEGKGIVLRRAVSIYSEHFSTFLQLSFIANLPTIFVGVMLLVLIPLIKISASVIAVYLFVLIVAIYFAFGINRAFFALVIEQILTAPLRGLRWQKIIIELKRRLGINETADARSYFSLYAKLLKIILGSSAVGTANILGVAVITIEGKNGREAIERSKLLVKRLPHILKGIVALLPLLVLVPTILFFLSALGILTLFKMNTETAIRYSLLIAFVLMALNYVWIAAPLPLALGLLYFRARQAGGETLEDL